MIMFVDLNAFNANEAGSPKHTGADLPAEAPTMSLECYGASPSKDF